MNKILMSGMVALLCLGGIQDTLGYGRGSSSSSSSASSTTYSIGTPLLTQSSSPTNVNVYASLHMNVKAQTNLPALITFLEPYLKLVGGQKIGTSRKVTGKTDLKKLRDALKAIAEGNATTATKKVAAAQKVFTSDYFSKDPLSKMVIEQAVTVLKASNFTQASPVYMQVQQLISCLQIVVANDKA